VCARVAAHVLVHWYGAGAGVGVDSIGWCVCTVGVRICFIALVRRQVGVSRCVVSSSPVSCIGIRVGVPVFCCGTSMFDSVRATPPVPCVGGVRWC